MCRCNYKDKTSLAYIMVILWFLLLRCVNLFLLHGSQIERNFNLLNSDVLFCIVECFSRLCYDVCRLNLYNCMLFIVKFHFVF